MANILSLFQSDGVTALPIQLRGGFPQPLIQVDLIYNDQGGSGVAEYVLRNQSSSSNAVKIEITTPNPPSATEGTGTLVQDWAYKLTDDTTWRPYASAITIDLLPPGGACRVRTQVKASPGNSPVTHSGTVSVKYLRSSVPTTTS